MGKRKKNSAASAILRDKKYVDNTLKKYFSVLKGPQKLLNAMKYAVFAGGKRLRPVLLLEACRAFGGSVNKALPFASAIELVHNFSLVHDDLPSMDDDDMRRGKPTCHKKFDEATAILAGDALINLAFGIIAERKHKRINRIISVMSKAIGTENMIGGQSMDLEYQKKNPKNKKLKRKIDDMKTAALMASSCEIGALVATSKKKDIKKMSEFGKNFGLAFQIKDDMNDEKFKGAVLQKMKNEIIFFNKKAKNNLVPFGKRADILRYIADKNE